MKKASEEALAIVQSLDPPGIAARDLRECLLNQLKPDAFLYEELKVLIQDHLEDLAENRLPLIEKKTGSRSRQFKPLAKSFIISIPSQARRSWKPMFRLSRRTSSSS